MARAPRRMPAGGRKKKVKRLPKWFVPICCYFAFLQAPCVMRAAGFCQHLVLSRKVQWVAPLLSREAELCAAGRSWGRRAVLWAGYRSNTRRDLASGSVTWLGPAVLCLGMSAAPASHIQPCFLTYRKWSLAPTLTPKWIQTQKWEMRLWT